MNNFNNDRYPTNNEIEDIDETLRLVNNRSHNISNNQPNNHSRTSNNSNQFDPYTSKTQMPKKAIPQHQKTRPHKFRGPNLREFAKNHKLSKSTILKVAAGIAAGVLCIGAISLAHNGIDKVRNKVIDSIGLPPRGVDYYVSNPSISLQDTREDLFLDVASLSNEASQEERTALAHKVSTFAYNSLKGEIAGVHNEQYKLAPSKQAQTPEDVSLVKYPVNGGYVYQASIGSQSYILEGADIKADIDCILALASNKNPSKDDMMDVITYQNHYYSLEFGSQPPSAPMHLVVTKEKPKKDKGLFKEEPNGREVGNPVSEDEAFTPVSSFEDNNKDLSEEEADWDR